MRVQTVRDMGALVRTTRRAHGLTQADLATRLRVSRDWVVRLEQGSPRLEAQKVLDALTVLGLTLDVDVDVARVGAGVGAARPEMVTARTSGRRTSPAAREPDPFGFLNDRTS